MKTKYDNEPDTSGRAPMRAKPNLDLSENRTHKASAKAPCLWKPEKERKGNGK